MIAGNLFFALIPASPWFTKKVCRFRGCASPEWTSRILIEPLPMPRGWCTKTIARLVWTEWKL